MKHFLLCNLTLLSLQLLFIYTHSSSFISAIPLPAVVYGELLLTLLIQGLLCVLLSACQTLWLRGLAKQRLVTIHLTSNLALLTTNAYFFPLSLFARDLVPLLSRTGITCIMTATWLLLGLLTYKTIDFYYKKQPRLASLVLLSILFIMLLLTHTPTRAPNQTTRAHIILIGVDSLHPAAVNPTRTPTLAQFIQHSAWFKETISPLARTYPAWSTILTGLYPAHHQANYNLLAPTHHVLQHSIAWQFQHNGYHTVFATDDRRFNSIDEQFGFQTVIGPKRGVNDILLGAFNDFPLSNLLINQRIGHWLFPYNHMNRASYFAYYPQTFDHALQQALAEHPVTQPLFLAVHFTLPHWPYAFAASNPAAVNDEYRMTHRKPLYHQALQAVDQQVANLLHTLKQHGYLDHSLVILLSDHGETLFTPHSRNISLAHYQASGSSPLARYFTEHTATPLTQSAGHGSDLLSPAQYHCVLAAQIYANKQLITSAHTITERVALLDLAPTLLEFAQLPTIGTLDGLSLLPSIVHAEHQPPARAFILESGMLPNQVISKQDAARLGRQYFTVTPQGLLQINPKQISELDRMKLYGIIHDDWLLALYPTAEGYLPVTQQLSTHDWIDQLNTPFAVLSPAHALLKQLSLFYHREFLTSSHS
jgi:arylsulfatase A-like enzyme